MFDGSFASINVSIKCNLHSLHTEREQNFSRFYQFLPFFFLYTRQKVNKTIRWIPCLILIFIWCAGGFYRYLQTPVKLTVARCSVWNCRLNNRTANSHHANSIFSITKHDRNIYCDCASQLCKFQSNFESETCECKCNVAAL